MKKTLYFVFMVCMMVILSACAVNIPPSTSYSVSGYVRDGESNPLEEVEIKFSNNYTSVTTQANGYWGKDNLEGSVTITPVKEGYSFTPASVQVSAKTANVNFTGTPNIYIISGKVLTAEGQGIAGVSLNLSNNFGSVVTTADGSWEKSGLSGTVSVTPVLPGWSFSPVSMEVTSSKDDVNFVGVQNVVQFADPLLDAHIRGLIGKATGDIYQTDLLDIDSLWLEGIGLTDLTGLEYLVNLEELDIWENQISDLSPLSQLPELAYIYAAYNQISDITPVASLPKLVWLAIGNNNISDISSLAGKETLTNLYIQENNLSDISALETLPNLNVLNVTYNPTGYIDSFLQQRENFSRLSICSDQIANTALLSAFSNLNFLEVSGNNGVRLTDVSFVTNLTNLEELVLWNNSITDITPVAGLTKLTYLLISDNNITDCSALAGLINLEDLYMYNNYISDIQPLVDNTGLGSGDWIYLFSNNLDISDPASDDMQNIFTLINRGANVSYSPQNTLASHSSSFERENDGRRK